MNFTDQLTKFNPYIPTIPVETYAKVGMAKQQMWEQGLQKIQGYFSSIGDLPVDGKFSDYIDNKLTHLKEQVSSTASGDFSNAQLVGQIGQAAATITKDPIVKNAVLSTQAIQDKLQYIKDIKTKHPELYSPINEADAMRSVAEWKKDPDLTTEYHDTTPYQPYYDTHKEISELEKSYMALPTSYSLQSEDANGKVTIKTYSGKSTQGLYDFINANGSENLKNQLALEGRVQSDYIDDKEWYDKTYVPFKQQQIANLLQQKSNLIKESVTDGSSNKQKEINTQVDRIKAQIAQIKSDLSDPEAAKAAIANKRNLNGQININTTLWNSASSLGINDQPKTTYDTDAATVAALDRALKWKMYQAKYGHAPGATTLAGSNEDAGFHQINERATSKDVTGSTGYDSFNTMLGALETTATAKLKDYFTKWAEDQGYSDKDLTNPDSLSDIRDKWMAYMTHQKTLWDSNKLSPEVPDVLKDAFGSNNEILKTAILMEKKRDKIKADAVQEAKSNGAHGVTIGDKYYSVEDIYDMKVSGKLGKLEKLYDTARNTYGNNVLVMGMPLATFGQPDSNITKQEIASLHELDKIKGLIPDVSDKFNNVVANVGYTEAITNNNFGSNSDTKQTPNKEAIQKLTDEINGYIIDATKNNETTDINGNQLKIANAIAPSQFKGAIINRLTGDVTLTVNLGSTTNQDLKTFTINIPDEKRGFTQDQIYETHAYLNDGVVPLKVQGSQPGREGKPLDIKIYSNGTQGSHYTLDASGNPALWRAKTNSGKEIAIPDHPQGFNTPSALVNYMNTITPQLQSTYIQTEINKKIDEIGRDNWMQKSQSEKNKIVQQVLKEALNNIDESIYPGVTNSNVSGFSF